MSYGPRLDKLENYVMNVGESIRLIWERLEKIQKAVESLEMKLAGVTNDVDGMKAFKTSVEADLNAIRESMLPRSDFDEFVKEINEVFTTIPFPPITPPTAPSPEEKKE